MRYLVVSDNHGDRDILEMLVSAYAGKVDGMFHCGDSELESTDELWEHFVVVKGNCDYGDGFSISQVQKIGIDTIFITHGHLLNVRYNLNQLSAKAKENAANIVLFGHTHELGCEVRDHVLYLNPGSISLPRGQYLIPSYAMIESDEHKYQVTYYDRNCNKIPKLHFTFDR